MLKTDLMEIFLAVSEERLSELDIQWDKGAAACVVMASGGYPQKYQTGLPISGLDENGQCGQATVYHAGTKKEDCTYLTGREYQCVGKAAQTFDKVSGNRRDDP